MKVLGGAYVLAQSATGLKQAQIGSKVVVVPSFFPVYLVKAVGVVPMCTSLCLQSVPTPQIRGEMLDRLPNELLLCIISHLSSVADLSRLSLINKNLNQLIDHAAVWRDLWRREWRSQGHPQEILSERDDDRGRLHSSPDDERRRDIFSANQGHMLSWRQECKRYFICDFWRRSFKANWKKQTMKGHQGTTIEDPVGQPELRYILIPSILPSISLFGCCSEHQGSAIRQTLCHQWGC